MHPPPTPPTVYIAFLPWHQTYRRNRKRKPLRHAWVLQKKVKKAVSLSRPIRWNKRKRFTRDFNIFHCRFDFLLQMLSLETFPKAYMD
jgi:hypothetical protein